jgi:hypothetical protein
MWVVINSLPPFAVSIAVGWLDCLIWFQEVPVNSLQHFAVSVLVLWVRLRKKVAN